LLEVRRDVYLEACDVSAEAVAYLLTMPSADVTLAVGAQLMRKVGGMNGKLHVIATQTTLEVSAKYLDAYLDEYRSAAVPKGKYEGNLGEIELGKFNLQSMNQVPRQYWPSDFLTTFTAWNKRIEELTVENAKLASEIFSLVKDAIDRLDPLATEVTLAFREEIEMDIDEVWYKNLRAGSIDRNVKRTQPLTEELRKHYEKLVEGRPSVPSGNRLKTTSDRL